jgi:hypothetical protein
VITWFIWFTVVVMVAVVMAVVTEEDIMVADTVDMAADIGDTAMVATVELIMEVNTAMREF